MAYTPKSYRKARRAMKTQERAIKKHFKSLIGTKIGNTGHHWELCPMCGPMVVCACGNNCCSGGSGKDCTCDEAYALQNEGYRSVRYKK